MPEILDILAARAALDPERIALVSDGVAVDTGTLWRRVGDFAVQCGRLPPAVGILAPNGTEWVVAMLALLKAGRRIVPIPEFFAPLQIAHILSDAGIGHVLVGERFAGAAGALPLPWTRIGQPVAGAAQPPGASEFVIYTSGSTGQPKGVRLSPDQIQWSAGTLIAATGATADDTFLSTLPLALLLELIGAIFAPLAVGGVTHLAADLPHAALKGDTALLAARLEAVRPSMTILVPELLRGLVATLETGGRPALDGLRFVAVGGAPVPAALSARAWALGLPVHEGYGLSECCSVVALNRPGANAPGTAGRPLDGLRVSIDDGEIVVAGPSVMAGYLGGAPTRGIWRTGDLGRLDPEGRLIVEGRKDNLLVTALGRNVSPEWIETLLLADPAVARAVVIGHGEPYPIAVIVPAVPGQTPDLAALTATAPDYARPRRAILTTEAALKEAGLLTANGRPRRAAIAAHFLCADDKPAKNEGSTVSFYDTLQQATAADRAAFLGIPALQRAVAEGVPLPLYLAYLAEAYHHVKFTVPLLALALARTEVTDDRYRNALIEYIDEEKGHEKWILDDIAALGGDAPAVERGEPGIPCRAMVGYVTYAIEHVSPYAMLGMVHVLEGMSVALAETAAKSIKGTLGQNGMKGFSYLTSHGGLDKEHVAFFKTLVDGIDDPAEQRTIVETARVVYRLFGDMFRELGAQLMERAHAA